MTIALSFKPGDKVRRLRNLEHPANKRRETDPRDGRVIFLKRDDLDELIGEGIVEGGNPRFHGSDVVLVHGFEYDAATGQQRGTGATYIEHVGQR